MPLYDFRCDCGVRFEKYVASAESPNPTCPRCDAATIRLVGRIALVGTAAPPPGDANAPTSFEGTHNGDREYIANWQRRIETRRKFEECNPEHATRREAVAAHEGSFESRPLTYRELAKRAEPTGDATVAAAEASRERKLKPAHAGKSPDATT